jgi:hypothetical protein
MCRGILTPRRQEPYIGTDLQLTVRVMVAPVPELLGLDLRSARVQGKSIWRLMQYKPKESLFSCQLGVELMSMPTSLPRPMSFVEAICSSLMTSSGLRSCLRILRVGRQVQQSDVWGKNSLARKQRNTYMSHAAAI